MLLSYDMVWLPVALFVARKGQRMMALAFTALCLMMVRVQVELIDSFGVDPGGITGWVPVDPFWRGEIVYGLAIAFFLVISYLSPGVLWVIYLAAALRVFLFAFAASMLVMAV